MKFQKAHRVQVKALVEKVGSKPDALLLLVQLAEAMAGSATISRRRVE